MRLKWLHLPREVGACSDLRKDVHFVLRLRFVEEGLLGNLLDLSFDLTDAKICSLGWLVALA